MKNVQIVVTYDSQGYGKTISVYRKTGIPKVYKYTPHRITRIIFLHIPYGNTADREALHYYSFGSIGVFAF